MMGQEEMDDLRADLARAVEIIATLRGENEELRQRITELEKKKTPPPSFVKPNRP